MTRQVKSKQRVADHGEVFTAEREVNAMLDLVKQETERIYFLNRISYNHFNLVIIEISYKFASCKNTKILQKQKTHRSLFDVYI
jgi:hypothetical protein